MKTFSTVIQIASNKFDVFKFQAETSKAIYPQTNKKGITIHVCESNDQNDKYCFELAKNMNKANQSNYSLLSDKEIIELVCDYVLKGEKTPKKLSDEISKRKLA